MGEVVGREKEPEPSVGFSCAEGMRQPIVDSDGRRSQRFEQSANLRKRSSMAAIRSKGTKPEMRVRKLLHSLGYRYRLHVKSLPGTPDLAFASRRKIVFVNGCFWHRHDCKLGSKVPMSNRDYWLPKFQRNVERDRTQRKQLGEMGWDVLTVWECEIEDAEGLQETLVSFLEG